jgi:hypothetical protein
MRAVHVTTQVATGARGYLVGCIQGTSKYDIQRRPPERGASGVRHNIVKTPYNYPKHICYILEVTSRKFSKTLFELIPKVRVSSC